jgi:hypothetical protein
MNFIVYEIDNTSYFSYDTTTKNNKKLIILNASIFYK